MEWELVGVPYTSMSEPGGIADGIRVLRDAGLAQRLTHLGVADGGDLELAEPSGERGSTGLLNESGLEELVTATRERVKQVHACERTPLMVGGDCPVLLGPLAALRDRGEEQGLVMLDGHEDAWPPSRSDTGEGSDSEVAIVLGLAPDLPPTLKGLAPLLERSALAQLGPRDSGELAEAGIPSLRGSIAYFADDRAVRTAGEDAMAAALERLDRRTYWLHVDLDVLSTADLAAVDYRQPGGLSWRELDRLSFQAAGDPRCRGVSIVIYNPDLDPQRVAARAIVDFASRLVTAC